jgi:uncharacterized protein YndB with AHSA1/START domain
MGMDVIQRQYESGREKDEYPFLDSKSLRRGKTDLTHQPMISKQICGERLRFDKKDWQKGRHTMDTKTMDAPKPKLATEALVIERTFDAKRERVWRAWSEPEQIMRWWGPQYFTSPSCKIDFRVGGRYLFCMRSPEGKDFWSAGVFLAITPFNRIAYTDSFADAQGNVVPATDYGMSPDFPLELNVTVTFEEKGGKTKMMLRHLGIPAGEMRELTRQGWGGSFDKLADSLR